MKVRQLVGRFAGQIVDMPFHVAQSCVSAGTAAWPDEPVRVRGLTADGKPIVPPKPEVRPVANYADRMMAAFTPRDGGRQFHPLDRDKDGAPGGSVPAAEREECEALRAEYKRLCGKDADQRWGEKRLRKEISRLS